MRILLFFAFVALVASKCTTDKDCLESGAKDGKYFCGSADGKKQTCVACRDTCDCAEGTYCSTNVIDKKAGSCLDYTKKVNTHCVPYDLTGIEVRKDDSKALDQLCALYMFVDSDTPGTPDWQGYCVEEKCVPCTETLPPTTQCGNHVGLHATAIACEVNKAYNLNIAQIGGVWWWSTRFFRLPENVWLLLICLELTGLTVLMIIARLGGGGKAGDYRAMDA